MEDDLGFEGFEDSPFLERDSHVFGAVRIYAPLAPTSTWGELPFLLRTEHNDDGPDSPPIRMLINAASVFHCYNHTSLISSQHMWEHEKAEVMAEFL